MTAIASTIMTEPPATALRVFVANVRAEWTKLRSVRSTVWTLLATVGPAVGFGALVGVSQMSSWDNLDPSERLRFDPTFFSLGGLWLAQLAVGVLGVLMVTSEYATGQIRATLGATPQRVTVLAARAATFTGVILTTGTVASFKRLLDRPRHLRLEGPRRLDLRAGGASRRLRWCPLPRRRRTPRHRSRRHPPPNRRRRRRPCRPPRPRPPRRRVPSRLVPGVGREVLPRPNRHGRVRSRPRPRTLAPWTGYSVLLAYVAGALVIGGLLFTRRDA